MGCGCKGNKTTSTAPVQDANTLDASTTEANQIDEQRVIQIKQEINAIVNKYYNDGDKTKS